MPPASRPRLRLEALPPVGRAPQVAEALSRYIDEANLDLGDRLPAERELMATLGIGRSSVREAVSQLQAHGVLEAHIGSGTYIRKPVSARTVHLPLSIEARDLADGLLLTLEVRRGVDVEASTAAARRRTPDDIAGMSEALDSMERVHPERRHVRPRRPRLLPDDLRSDRQSPVPPGARAAPGHFERFSDQPFDRPDFAGRSFPFTASSFRQSATATRPPPPITHAQSSTSSRRTSGA